MHGVLARIIAMSLMAGGSLVAAPASAQAPASAIAGTVRDTSGAVLPGVSVEASSPALIEKTRTSVTDGQGRYSITELRPGIYVVTFRLSGFATLIRENIELASGFTANVTVEMRVGGLEESVTVSGASPLVDVQNVRQQTVVARDELDALPIGQGSTSSIVSLIPGLSDGGKVDIGGSGGAWEAGRATYGTFHGKFGMRTTMDGMRTQNTGTGKAPGYTVNTFFVQEIAVETGGISAEGSASAMAMNHIVKEGANRFSFTAEGRYMNESMQSANLSEELRARGATTPQTLENLHDMAFYVGGPVLQDRLWFYSGYRRWGFRRQIPGLFENASLGQVFYTPDTSRPVSFHELDKSYGGRLTWQVREKDKIAFFTDYQDLFMSHGATGTPSTAPEAQNPMHLKPSGIVQASWTSTRTNRLLLEAGAGWMIWHNYSEIQPGVSPDAISILETSTNFRYNAPATYYGQDGRDPWVVDRFVQRASLSYVTGTHSLKSGIQLEQGIIEGGVRRRTGPTGAVDYRFFQGAPTSLTQTGNPFVERAIMNPDLGIFIQDQWRLDRLTLNLGLRFDYWNGYVPEQTIPATAFLPAAHFDKVSDTPNFKDINPRMGVVYDLFGSGRTALKASLGRYNDLSGLFYTQVADPSRTSIRDTTRPWTDFNQNFVPDCDLTNFAINGECGGISNQNFGKQNPRSIVFADEVMRGWGKRPYTWDIATELQHELVQGVSVTGGYYYNWDGNVRALVNEAVTPADYDEYCITTPVDPRLPGAGGQRVCGLYDVSQAKFGQFSEAWKQSANLDSDRSGSTRVSRFASASMDARLKGGIRINGGIDAGRSIWDTCFVADNPQKTTIVYVTANVGQRAVEQRYCHEVQPWLANLQIKLNGSAPLPGGAMISVNYQNLAGQEILADYTATSAEIAPSLGRPLSGGTRTVSIPIIASYNQYEDRRTQLDMRFAKTFNFSPTGRLQVIADLYNIFNVNAILGRINTYGPAWGRPTSIVPGRMLQLGVRLNY